MKLEVAIMRLFFDADKEAAYRSLLSVLGIKNDEPLSVEAQALISSPELRQPKNWRPLDYIQVAARRLLSVNGDYTFNKIPLSTKAMLGSIGLEQILDARIVDLGCGVFDPLLQSIYLYCNGAQSVLAVDTEPCQDHGKAGFVAADMLADFLAEPEKWCLGVVGREEFLRRALAFNTKAFRDGNLKQGLGIAPINYRIGFLQNLCAEPASQDIVISFSVLEHVMDLKELLDHIRMILAPGGHLVSQIDFSDHRQFTPGFHFWSFMTKDGPHQPGINEIRASQFCHMLGEANFKVTSFAPSRASVPDEIRHNLKERFSCLSDDDLSIISAYFSARALQ